MSNQEFNVLEQESSRVLIISVKGFGDVILQKNDESLCVDVANKDNIVIGSIITPKVEFENHESEDDEFEYEA
ncbi:hypothetical protein A3715_18290 [Oleiphilus sp. HI0009]|nr:hypothetical protein A3715_18290 [Oleiphilus sp. HI0009]